VKPFAFEELLARVRALLRRGYGQSSNVVTVGRLSLDLSAHTATVDGKPLELTSREFAVLELFALKPGATWTRTQLVERLYDEGSDRDSNVIDVFVARLRKKLEAAGLPGSAMIRTQRGLGYRFDPTGGDA
jgi:DNA-binding response OmpR family regulator